ncbi:futalosine hydrolase [Alkalihalobacillus sp. MEB130]|uniref:futalosine hydrolase n=1 Tax=Alkalihalobacillus sp. MEB130 TaxID=2976704 RepID=UPI0028E00556|nr:futalosine hydrolase [Alkalihalobacillus sp. MEB130]MDT8862443.1 futalosine hydrolase [Alkalihalobacillus sp. MEB130]
MNKQKAILIVTSVHAEKEAIEKGIRNASQFDIIVAGVGQAAAAARTATALAKKKYDYVINAGIAGGFEGRADMGSIVISTDIIAADLGAESSEGFLSLEELHLGDSKLVVDGDMVNRFCTQAVSMGVDVHQGAILTLSTVTGTQETTDLLLNRFPDAVAEGMEGFGVAEAAKQHGVPVMEMRSISNKIGPRDRDAWRIKEALAMLEKASSVMVEVFS